MRRLAQLGGRQPAPLIAVAMFCIFAFAAPDFFVTSENLGNIARQVSLDAPIVFGQTIVLIAGGIDVSVGSTMAMAAALAIGLQPQGTLFAVAVALLFGVAVGALNGLLVTRGRIVPFVATLGTMSLIRGILLTYTRQQPLSGEDDAFTWWGGGSLGPLPVPLLITLLFMAALSVLLQRTRAGRNIYAIGGSRDAAYLAGISVERYQMLAFVLCGTLAGAAGVLLAARLDSASVQIGNDTPLLSISAALIGGASLLGGRGNLVGALLGALALGMLTNGMNLVGVQTYRQIAVRALVLIGVVAVDALAVKLARRRVALAQGR